MATTILTLLSLLSIFVIAPLGALVFDMVLIRQLDRHIEPNEARELLDDRPED